VARYLLAAEADKIQDLIFRSARLREVVGGSQLLTRFCAEVPCLLLPRYGGKAGDIVINDGGSFRILFDDVNQAKAFGAQLAEVYRRAAGGSLTVAEPALVNGDFHKASEQAEENLRQAKRQREGWQSQAQFSYMAFCASCGVGLAVAHQRYHEDEDSQYLCAACLNKSAEPDERELGSFLERFYQVVEPGDLNSLVWPGKEECSGRTGKDPVEDVADHDPRRYVAYLLADGNDIGKLFNKCDEDQMRALSKGLIQAMRLALAAPTRMAMAKQRHLSDRSNFIPVLPMILGGDDLFALVPAPWALDFAYRFCQEYEREMGALLERVGIHDALRPTISSAVVICKSKHPYTLAHQAGEARLKEAKRLGKRAILDGGQPYSTVNFEVVLGGRLVSESPSGQVRPTLRPYWATEATISGWGLSVQQLMAQRWNLRHVPHKRLAELQSLYDPANLPALRRSDEIALWQARLEPLLKRLERSEEQGTVVREALRALGGDKSGWYRVDRYPEDCWYGHGLPDLLEAWDFALDLKEDRKAYEEE